MIDVMFMLCISTKTEADVHANKNTHYDYSSLESNHQCDYQRNYEVAMVPSIYTGCNHGDKHKHYEVTMVPTTNTVK